MTHVHPVAKVTTARSCCPYGRFFILAQDTSFSTALLCVVRDFGFSIYARLMDIYADSKTWNIV